MLVVLGYLVLRSDVLRLFPFVFGSAKLAALIQVVLVLSFVLV